MNAKTNNDVWPTRAQEQAHRLQLAKWCALHKMDVPSGPIVDAFVKAMGSNQYGVEETWDAFVWFQSGFEAGVLYWNSITIKPVIIVAEETQRRCQEDDAAMGGGPR